jgi:hypothetical protein
MLCRGLLEKLREIGGKDGVGRNEDGELEHTHGKIRTK